MASGGGTGTPVEGGARVSVSDVKAIFDTDLIDSEISVAITMANTLISAHGLAAAGVTEAVLTEIERLLAAHFCALKDPRTSKEAISGEVSASYQGQTKTGLKSTFYGQNAILLDYSGILATIAEGAKRAVFSVERSVYDEFDVSASEA